MAESSWVVGAAITQPSTRLGRPTRASFSSLSLGVVEIAWQSASFAPLLPVFAGRLSISADDIVRDGRYAPPVGKLGLLLDQAPLHLVARRTAGGFVQPVRHGAVVPAPEWVRLRLRTAVARRLPHLLQVTPNDAGAAGTAPILEDRSG